VTAVRPHRQAVPLRAWTSTSHPLPGLSRRYRGDCLGGRRRLGAAGRAVQENLSKLNLDARWYATPQPVVNTSCANRSLEAKQLGNSRWATERFYGFSVIHESD
jgi:hypothetical protein